MEELKTKQNRQQMGTSLCNMAKELQIKENSGNVLSYRVVFRGQTMETKDKAYKPIRNFCVTLQDCPAIAKYRDAVYFLKSAFPLSLKNC